jgi:hypothetical protein
MKSKLEDPEKKADGGRIGFKGGADFATVADSKGNVGAKSVNVSPSGSVTTSNQAPSGPDDKSNFTQNVNHREAMRNYQKPKESKIKKAIETGSEISFLNNLYKMNPVGLGLNIGGKMFYNKFFDDQAMLDTEDEGIMQMADLNPLGLTQMRNLEKKKAMEPLGGDPFTDKDQQMLDELERRDADPDKTYGPVLAADGGRIGYKVGTGKKGVEGLIDLIRNKFGKKSITTADKAPIPPKTLERDMFKKADENFKNKRMLTDDEYQDFLDEVGGADQLEAYDFDGTVGDAKRIIREQKRYMDDMELEYKKGNLDPGPGEKGRKEFLQKKLDEVEASGDQRLMTSDEIEELSSLDSDSQMDVVKTLAPKMVERLQLKKKYPGITDDLLDKILIDDNVQRKAEVLATIDEAFKMMEKGKSADEILDTMKNVTRTKQADGGITRIGYKVGSVDKMRRLILKAMGAGTLGVGAAKSGIFSFGKGAGKEVAKEVVQKSTTTPPPYFFKLAEKIKMLGDDATATTDRTIAKTLKSKDGKSTYYYGS